MPFMDGYEATEHLIILMKEGVLTRTPILALSANYGEEIY